jgi:adenylate kinase family enzyme
MTELTVESPACADQEQQIIKELNQFFGLFPQVRRVLEKIDDLYRSPKRLEPKNLLILGESGVGKSRLLKRVREQHPPVDRGTFTEIPVLYVVVPAKSSIDNLAGAMLRAMGSLYWNKGKTADLTVQLETLIKECQVKLIIIDEVNRLVDKGGVKTHHLLAEWIKELSDAVKVPMVLAGIPRAARLLDTNDQLRSRFRQVVNLRPFSARTETDMDLTRRVMRTFEGRLKEIPCTRLDDSTTTSAIIFATDGRLRDIHNLLECAVISAFRLSRTAKQPTKPAITSATLASAFREAIYAEAPDTRNPFTKKFNGTPLTKLGEPFAPREE